MTILLLIIYVKARLNNGTSSHGQTTDWAYIYLYIKTMTTSSFEQR